MGSSAVAAAAQLCKEAALSLSLAAPSVLSGQ